MFGTDCIRAGRAFYIEGAMDVVKKIFYTVQSRKAWQNWKRQGYLQARDTGDPDFKGSYAWMKEQMKLRLPGYKWKAI